MNKHLDSFEIKDPAIDEAKIRQIISKNIEQRQTYAQNQVIDFEKLAQPVSLPEEAKRSAFDLMEHYQTDLLIKPYRVPSDQNLVRRFILWLKKQAHNLVIYYVNILGKKLTLFNQSVVYAMATRQAQTEDLQERVINLEKKIEWLEARLAAREAQLDE